MLYFIILAISCFVLNSSTDILLLMLLSMLVLLVCIFFGTNINIINNTVDNNDNTFTE